MYIYSKSMGMKKEEARGKKVSVDKQAKVNDKDEYAGMVEMFDSLDESAGPGSREKKRGRDLMRRPPRRQAPRAQAERLKQGI